ncbi:MAG: M12 family metallo-peptidase [Bacteroidota bacterium]
MKNYKLVFSGFLHQSKVLKSNKKRGSSSWFILAAFILASSFSFGQNKIFESIQEAKNNRVEFQSIEMFEKAQQNYERANVFHDLDEVNLLNYDLNLAEINKSALSFSIPLGKNIATVDVVEVLDSFYDVQVVSNQGEEISPDRATARHYRGVVRGKPNSLVAISFFDDDVMGIIATEAGNYNVGKVKSTGQYIIYNDANLIPQSDFECETHDDDFEGYDPEVLMREENSGPTRAYETNCVRFYFETEFDIFQNLGSLVAVQNYVTALYNQVAIIYQNEGIDTSVSQIFVWTTADPYTGTNTATLLSQFQANTGAFNGDLGQLLTFRNAGGGRAAGFAGICNANTDLSLSVSANLTNTVVPVPTYSWNVMVVSHEFGHLFGSRHTHACVWNGNNTAIDGCAGGTEGSCALPGIPPLGGTIMSYCHIQTVGINFTFGFGGQPGNVIRDRVANGACLTDCDTCPASTTAFDIYTKDRPFDVGLEPNPDTGPMWISEDIWVRQDLDGGTTPQNPEYKLHSPNGVYVNVRNLSTTTPSECAVLKVYFSKASTGLQWPVHFNNYYQNVGANSVLHGDIIGTATIPSIPAGGTITIEIPWYPPDPGNFTNDVHHFCLVSRILSPNDPMFLETTGSVSPNVRRNNNIAWKNLSVYDATPGNLPPPPAVFVRGINERSDFTNIEFYDEGFEERIERRFFDHGVLEIEIEEELFQRMREAGSLEGQGIEIIGDNMIRVYSREAILKKVQIRYKETFWMRYAFKVDGEIREGEQILLDVIQSDYERGTFQGGERFALINDKERASIKGDTSNLAPSFDIVPNPSDGIFNLKLNNVTNGTYYVYDIYGNVVLKGTINNEKVISINISDARSNLFFVKVVSGEHSSNKVMIKR